MKFCSKCGTQLEPEMTVCPGCGKPLAAAAPAAAPQPVSAPVAVQQSQPAHAVAAAPFAQLKTNRGLLKYILLSLITFGIYGLVVMSSVSQDINTIVGPRDGKHTMHYCLLFFIVSPITLGIGGLVWFHKLSNRIYTELNRRNISYSFSANTYWGWSILGSVIAIGPLVYLHKLFHAMNLLSEHYNYNG